MRSCLLRCCWLSSACFLLLLSASSAGAQCSTNTIGYAGVGVIPGNPFRAEIVVTTSAKSPRLQHALIEPRPESVARDAQGRIRRETVAGEYKRDTGAEAGSKVEEHMIQICDTTAETLTVIDTMNATAKIIHARSRAVHSVAPLSRSFCSKQSPFRENLTNMHMSFQDLGTQNIEGVEVHGVRIKRSLLATSDSGDPAPGETITDTWCSEELSAVVLTVTDNPKIGMKHAVAMRNIVLGEQDAALFEIPADYAVTESVEEPRESNGGVLTPRVQP